MKNPELFTKTIGILVKAYMNDTLVHNTCYSCAVGNLVAANMGYNVVDMKNRGAWVDGERNFKAMWHMAMGRGCPSNSEIKLSEIQVISTGYTKYELMEIESAFEGVNMISDYDTEGIYNGLMSVCDALMLIHSATPTECAEAKEMFVR